MVPAIRHARISSEMGASTSLIYYGPGVRQDSHDHDAPHISILLAGSFEETSYGQSLAPDAGTLRVRVQPFRHAVRFGPNGALMLRLPLQRKDCGADLVRFTSWLHPHHPRMCGRILHGILRGDDDASALIGDFLAYAKNDQESRGVPPAWLSAAHRRLRETPSTTITALAEHAGVTCVHFARVFKRYYHLAPSVMRRKIMLEKALRAMLARERGPAAAALEAGFADQSHLTRVTREITGVSPARLVALFA